MSRRGDGYTFKRGNVFWCSFYLNGEEQRESTHTDDPKQAEKYLKDRIIDAATAKRGLEAFSTAKMAKQTVGELLDSLKSDFELRGKLSPQNLCCINKAKDAFGHHTAMALRPEHVDTYIKGRLAQGYKPGSINRIIQYTGQAFTLAIKEGRITRKPYFRRLDESGNARQGFCVESKFREIHSYLPEPFGDFCLFLYSTGMRCGEAKSLRWQDMDGDCLKLLGTNAKNGHSRIIPLVGELAAILERRRAARQFESNGTTEMSALIFHKNGKPIGDFSDRWRHATEKAGAQGLLIHDLRRSAVRNLIRAGVARDVAKKISGHRSDTMFSRYNITDVQDIRAALAQTEIYRQERAKVPASNIRALTR